MTMPPLPEQEEREPDNVSESGDSGRSNDPARLTGGAWFSLAVSFGVFLLMVAIGVKYHVAAQSREEPAEPDRYVVANASVPAAAAASTLPADASETLLARARGCAATAQWDCVIETTSGVIAQRGNTPETKALLAQAIVNGGWAPGNAHNVREVSTMPPESKRPIVHDHRHRVRAERLRYAALTRRNSTDEMADIYRH